MSINHQAWMLRYSVLWFLTVSMPLITHAVQAKGPNLEFAEVAAGVYLHLGKHEEMSVDNLGDIANIGFIIGNDSVAVIDPGGSPQLGQRCANQSAM